MSLSLPIYSTLIAISIPAIQQILLVLPLRRTWPIALLMYVPGFLFVLWAIDDNARGGGRLEIVYVLTSPSVFAELLSVLLLAAVYTLVFEVLRRLRVDDWTESEESRFTPGLYRPMACIAILLLAMCICSVNYKSLEDAVLRNDLELARSRLEFNLAGVGPNNGRIEDWGTAGIHTSPLLPVAVKNGSIQMVKILLQSGAEINPSPNQSGINSGSNPEWNMMYYATINDDMPMLQFLVEQGADPTRNILPAVREKNVNHLEFLLSHGADVETVRNELRSQNLEGVLDEMLAHIAEQPVAFRSKNLDVSAAPHVVE